MSQIESFNGCYFMQPLDDLADSILITNSADLSKNEKNVYLSILMDESQLKAILDNAHLFDKSLVNAANLLMLNYKNLNIEYSIE